MTTFMRPVPPTDMQLVLHKGGWQVSVYPTFVESNLTVAGPCEGFFCGTVLVKVKTTNLINHRCGFVP